MMLCAARAMTGKLAVTTFFALVLLPVAMLGHDGPWFGPGDISIRGRAPFPAKFGPGAFRAFDLWFADRVGLRYPLIYVGTNLHVGLLHRPLDRHIVFGREGWMYWTDDRDIAPATMADSRGKLRFTPLEARRIDTQLQAVHAHLAACGIQSAVFIAPNKQSIYGEYLVNADSGSLPPTRLDALIGEVGGVAKDMIIDPRPTMRMAKRLHAPLRLYNKTETHWNWLGAYYAYRALLEKIASELPVAHPELASFDNYHMAVGPYEGGDMATRVLFSPWRFPDEDILVAPNVTTIPDMGQRPVGDFFVQRNPRGSGKILLLGDSFAIYLVPFLANHFREVYRVVAERFDGSLIAAVHPDLVVLETVESYLPRLLLPPLNLERTCDVRSTAAERGSGAQAHP